MTKPPISNPTRVSQVLTDSELLRISLADDFEILEELGRGGMAIVFRARDKALGREVAIKVLPARLMSDTALVERFEHEARTAGNLEHPNIIPIYRVGRAGPEGGVSYFVMKLLRGQSLSAMLKERGKLPPDELRTLLLETASALGYAAKHNVVHRDIKPDNILFDAEGRSVLVDFGIAKTPGVHHSVAGTLVGTPRYMSPEHALSQVLDGRSDLYSLGVVAYEALFGKPPFDSDDPLELISKHIHEPVPASPLWTDEERELYPVIARMLAKKPEDRFQSADEVILALGGQVLHHAQLADAARESRVSTVSTVTTETGMPSVSGDPVIGEWQRRIPSWTNARPIVRIGVGALAAAAIIIATLLAMRPVAPRVSAAALPLQSPRTPSIGATMAAPTITPRAAAAVAETKTTPATPAATNTALPAVTHVTASAPKPKPKPSAHAAAILAYDKLASSCAKRDTMPDAKAIDYAVLLDSMKDRPRSDRMNVVYDVCGLPGGTPFTARFTLTKLRQRGFGQQKPHEETVRETAGSPRSREKHALDTREMSAGSYRLDVMIDAKGKASTVSREFRISE
jgi:serine/threonine protein kinase